MTRAPRKLKRTVDSRLSPPGAADAIQTADRLIADVERPEKPAKPPKAAGFKSAARGERTNPSVPRRTRGPSGPALGLGDQTGPRKPATTDSLRKGVNVGTPSGADPEYGGNR